MDHENFPGPRVGPQILMICVLFFSFILLFYYFIVINKKINVKIRYPSQSMYNTIKPLGPAGPRFFHLNPFETIKNIF